MRTYGTMSRGSLFAVVALTNALASDDARASWPPPPDATSMDVADPKNWPNDPAYGHSAVTDGQWTHYGFLPDAAAGIVRREGETAAGMSIDLAWRISIGDPRVIIAVADTGILWDEPELRDKIFINRGELSFHKPRHADHSACGGVGELVGFDCNGDGVFSVSDYAESLNVPAHDRNGNGVIDAGDLVLAFSDHFDDDGNGYVDDIAGWDFMKDDNDPFDDTRHGHGTLDAVVAAASTNNGISGAGVCPRCVVLPLRVADSLSADAHDFAQAVVYATDAGAKVVQSALLTSNMTRFADAALEYAHAHKVLVVTATSHVGSRDHDMPATSNHTLVVHALGYDGTNVASSRSFLDAHACAGYGSQSMLSASSANCTSGVAGTLAGIAGLMASTVLEQGLTPGLTAGEMRALLTSTADDVHIPGSGVPGSPYRYSQKGFDERFGYGRINASRALEAIVARRIPSDVNITSPRWFQTLHVDAMDRPIEIRGSIAAPRANDYEYVIDWAIGVEPLDKDFEGHVIATQRNLDPTTQIGNTMPLALLDVRHASSLIDGDAQGLNVQNDHAFTVRVRTVAHNGSVIGDAPSEVRRTFFVHKDPDLVPGFPLALGDSLESGPKMADVDGDGIRDLVVLTSGGLVHVFALMEDGPISRPGFPFRTNVVDGLAATSSPGIPSYAWAPAYASGAVNIDVAREGFVNAPAIADLDGDGSAEIVASSLAGTIYVIEPDGSSRPGFPKTLPRVPSCSDGASMGPATASCMDADNRIARGAFASPVLVDLDGDNKLDIVQAAFDGRVYAFDEAGNAVAGFPVDVNFSEAGQKPVQSRIMTTPAVADMNDDGIFDIAVGSSERIGQTGNFGALYVIDGRGMAAPFGPILPGWPITIASSNVGSLFADGLTGSPAIARFAGTIAVVAHGNGSVPFVLPSKPGTQTTYGALPEFALPEPPDPTDGAHRGLDPTAQPGPFSRVAQPNTMLGLLSSPAVGDIDQDGEPDVVTAGGSASLVDRLRGQDPGALGEHQLAAWSGATGAMLPGSPFLFEGWSSLQDHAIADLDGDDYPEIIGGTSGYFLHAYDGCGREPLGFPKFTGQWIAAAPAVGDLDGDGELEVAVGTRSGLVYVWRTRGRTDGVIAWESFHHDNRNTGNLEVPLDQGRLRKAASPLVNDACREPLPYPGYRGRGGCTCRVVSGDEPASPLMLFIGGVCVTFTRRRARR